MAKEENKETKGTVYQVFSTVPVYHCAKRKFTQQPFFVEITELTEEQIQELKADLFIVINGPMDAPA